MASIIRSVASGQGGTLADHARLLARVYTNAADALIVTWRDKARYSFWRPFTAIREAASDRNHATDADPDWTALIATPPYPDHPSGLSAFGGAVVGTMQHFYGRDRATFSGTTPGGVTRQFTSFSRPRDDIVEAASGPASTSGSPTRRERRSGARSPTGATGTRSADPDKRPRALQREGAPENRPASPPAGRAARTSSDVRKASPARPTRYS